jgi:hypothetical protein
MAIRDPATVSEEVLAELAAAAYHVVQRHGGVRSPFIDVELDLWRELRRVLHATKPADRPHVASCHS